MCLTLVRSYNYFKCTKYLWLWLCDYDYDYDYVTMTMTLNVLSYVNLLVITSKVQIQNKQGEYREEQWTNSWFLLEYLVYKPNLCSQWLIWFVFHSFSQKTYLLLMMSILWLFYTTFLYKYFSTCLKKYLSKYLQLDHCGLRSMRHCYYAGWIFQALPIITAGAVLYAFYSLAKMSAQDLTKA